MKLASYKCAIVLLLTAFGLFGAACQTSRTVVQPIDGLNPSISASQAVAICRPQAEFTEKQVEDRVRRQIEAESSSGGFGKGFIDGMNVNMEGR